MISLARAAWQEELRFPELIGLSSDGFPSSSDYSVTNGAEYYMMDTGKTYKYDKQGDTWRLKPTGGGGGGEAEPPVNFGYYYEGDFYTDAEHTQLIVPIAGGLYFDIEGRKLYVSDGAEYIDNDDAKLDKPIIPGQLDQVLTSNGDGTQVWKAFTCDASDITQKDGELGDHSCIVNQQ